jgi:hypothetical protein
VLYAAECSCPTSLFFLHKRIICRNYTYSLPASIVAREKFVEVQNPAEGFSLATLDRWEQSVLTGRLLIVLNDIKSSKFINMDIIQELPKKPIGNNLFKTNRKDRSEAKRRSKIINSLDLLSFRLSYSAMSFFFCVRILPSNYQRVLEKNSVVFSRIPRKTIFLWQTGKLGVKT